MSRPVTELTHALTYAAEAHANQRRKGAAREPYINHLIEVLDLVARATDGQDMDAMIAALLHDTVEDTGRTGADLAAVFGDRVAGIVLETSDDMALPKDERRRQRIAGMAHKSPTARLVKTADVISNVRAVAVSAPAGWGKNNRLRYLDGCRQMVAAARGTNPWLEALFDDTATAAERSIRDDASLDVEGHSLAIRHLENAIGQPVHLIYMANTENRTLTRADTERMADLIAPRFPSGTIEPATAVYDGALRDILIARVRTDSTAAIVALAQALCLAFDQRFVGIEVGGRYIRIYSDDTG